MNPPEKNEVGSDVWVGSLSDEELCSLLDLCEEALRKGGKLGRTRTISEARAKRDSGIAKVRDAHYDALDSLTADLESGAISREEFDQGVHDALLDGFTKAYQEGKPELDAGDEEWIHRAVGEEMGYARKFGDDLEDEALIMPREERVGMYSRAIDGVYDHARIESMPDDLRIHWRLGQAEHCEDCLILACILNDSMLIDTLRGRVPLREVQVGDMVSTHLGRWRRVSEVRSTLSDGRQQPAVLVTRDGLAGFTGDHGFWTSRGWMPAWEVSVEGERCLQGLRQGDRQEGGPVQVVRPEGEGEVQAAGRSDGGGLRFDSQEAQVGGELLRGQEKDHRLAPPVGVGEGERTGAEGNGGAPRQRGPVGRQVRESAAQGEGEARQGPHERAGEPQLEGSEEEPALSQLRQEVQFVPEPVLLSPVLSGVEGREGEGKAGLRGMREGVHEEAILRGGEGGAREPARLLLSRLLSRVEVGGEADNDPAVRLLREEFRAGRVPDQELEVGQVLLLPGLLPRGTPLHDLTIEDDSSFVAGGMVVHNSNSPYTKWDLPTTPRAGATQCLSNCKCRLEFVAGDLTDEELADVQQSEMVKDTSLADLMTQPEPPEGLDSPDANEQRYIDDLRNRINYNRRLIDSEGLDEDALKEAIFARKEANAALTDFLEREGLHEVPTWSVGDVLDSRDVGRRAVQDIFRHGLDGRSLDKVSQKKLQSLLAWYEDQTGETLSGEEP